MTARATKHPRILLHEAEGLQGQEGCTYVARVPLVPSQSEDKLAERFGHPFRVAARKLNVQRLYPHRRIRGRPPPDGTNGSDELTRSTQSASSSPSYTVFLHDSSLA
ncbi:hypothetical protein WOLCODRAFT_167403 [Wolfiporia cocos MD-104 SS10]|uniref:Uncharacterized protein n=1 Tax=Wolfiporia cocos (strain MD-104) TaxID=742152 RepID=A0A2H3JMM2_WOLCO|nr:hypothetical protein WOLCODRAFT_167403 [Wolfiporia cocos MD-104 SS10]